MAGVEAGPFPVTWARRLARKSRGLVGIKQLPELDRRLARMEQVFHSPPLTPELIAAIRLISPQFGLAPKKSTPEVLGS
jgi:hypothetical protein